MGLEKFGKCLSMAAWMSLLVVYAYAEGSSRKWRNEVLKQVNSKGPYIGLITVFPPEETAFFGTGAFKPSPIHSSLDLSGRRFRIGKVHDKKVIYVRCGVGMVNAAAATQQMVDLFEIVGIIHFGIAGNINASMSIGDITIPKQFAHTGIWDWVNQNGTLDSNDTVAHLDFETYNVPKGGHNILGQIRYIHEEFFSVSGEPNIARPLFWLEVNQEWLHVATKLERMELEQCINKSLCLPKKPKLVVGLRGTTANIFVDNAAYRDFLFHSFHVASTDMESAAVVMTSVSNGIPVIVIRGLSDKAGGQSGQNAIKTFGPLAARNAAKAVLQFLKQLN
ncbi:bark storage protein A isoform X1 [Ziziphus jujuba]|uniref:Bark storage protein A isoform X1 n=1 Tax=Ziziphus jujuba TaxID=326968 RepID=A0A6P3ZCH3_ZIZJJ|nr:bark storage protein A isoform X1 [Ziziphus jujuba]